MFSAVTFPTLASRIKEIVSGRPDGLDKLCESLTACRLDRLLAYLELPFSLIVCDSPAVSVMSALTDDGVLGIYERALEVCRLDPDIGVE